MERIIESAFNQAAGERELGFFAIFAIRWRTRGQNLLPQRTQRMHEGRKEIQIRTSVAPSPMFQSFPAVRAGVLRRSDRLRRSRPTSSARASKQPALPTSPLDQTDRGPR